MGNCASSVHSNTDQGMVFGVEIESPVAEKIVKSTETENPVSDLGFEEAGVQELVPGKEEFFFDSQAGIDSDCEDFFSVNGDCTPQGTPTHPESFIQSPLNEKPPGSGTTPIHPDSFIKTPQNDKAPSADDVAPPNDTKKLLAELFRESFNSTAAVNGDGYLERLTQPERSAMKSSYEGVMNSSHSSEATPPQRGCLPRKSQCCLPAGLVRNLSFGERKKKLNSSKMENGKPYVNVV